MLDQGFRHAGIMQARKLDSSFRHVAKMQNSMHHSVSVRRSYETGPDGQRKWVCDVGNSETHEFESFEEAHRFARGQDSNVPTATDSGGY